MEKQQELFKQLMDLTSNSESFFFKDFNLDDKVYRIFNYRLASWTEFQLPGALDARGIMFDVTNENDVFVVSMPPQKFFNYEEGNVDHSKYRFGDKMVKMDGSLISTYLHKDQLYMKSKGSLFSSQALDSLKLLDKEENKLFKEELYSLVKKGWTVNLEYTSPENRIVIPYQTEELTILSAREHKTGRNLFATRLEALFDSLNFKELKNHLVDSVKLHDQEIEHTSFVDAVRKEQEGEGYVVEVIVDTDNSYLTKLKNIKYVTLHQTKDSVNSTRHLFEAVIEEATDDLRSLFFDDPYVLNKIEEMEQKVRPIFNHIVKSVEEYHANNKHLERKEFAIKAQKEIADYFGLTMNMYNGKKVDFKDYAKKKRKEVFGIDDVIHDPEEENSKKKMSLNK